MTAADTVAGGAVERREVIVIPNQWVTMSDGCRIGVRIWLPVDAGVHPVPAVLEAQWRLLDRNGQLRDSRLLRLEEAHSGTLADQAQAQSRLLRQLARQLADAIEPLRNQPVAEATKPAPAPARPSRPPQPGPKIPMVGPTPSNGDVLRF